MSNSRWSGLVVGVIVSAAAAMTVAVACSSQDSGSEAREGEQRGNSSDRLIQAPPNAGVVTVAGPTAAGASGGFVDNAVATLGKLNDPAGVAVAADGTIYVADWGNNAVRRITPGGALETLLKAETPNAVKNPRSEEIPATPTSPPPQWTVVSGTWRSASKATCSSCGDSFDGSRWFGGTGGELRQDVDLTAYQNNPAFGGYYLAVDARLGTGATARVKLESLNAAGDVVAVREDLQLGGATWQHTGRIGSAPPPPKARITLIAAGSTGAEAYFDAVQLRVLDSSVPWPISGMHGLSSVAITSTGGLLVGASDVYSMTTSGGSQAKILSTPGVVSSIAPVSDGYAYFVDSTQRDLYVRSNTGVNYRAFVDGEANGEPLAVVATVQGSGHRLWVTFRRYYNIYAYDCPKSTTANATVTCTFANVRFGGSKGFAPDMDGTAGGERFSNPHSIALGKFGDILIADEGNHAILRGLLPLTQISAGTGVLGFKDGASNQAQFWSPSGVAAAPDGSIVVADRMNNRIRKILCAATNVCAASGNSCPIAPTNDNNTCTTDSCMVLAVRNEPLANGASCNDSSACTTSDVCSAGVCSGTPVPTDDQLLCTVDSCDPASGPVHTPKTFTDPNTTDCLVPVCDPATGNAKTVPAAEGTSCAGVNSGRFCDHASVCEATPAPTFTAPTLDASTGTDFTQLTNGIWNGTGAIQTGVTTSIEVGRAGWLIGQVKTAAGNALPNVEVTIAGDATYGKTFTRGDGRFDFIVNGGRSYTVRFQKAGHLPSDRQVYVGWEETSVVKDVILLTASSAESSNA